MSTNPTQESLTLKERLLAPTSPFFAKLANVGIIIAILAGAFVGASDSLVAHGLPIPVWLTKVTEVLAWLSAGAAGASKLTVSFDWLQKQSR